MDIDITEALATVHSYMAEIGDQPFRLGETDLDKNSAAFLLDNNYVVVGADGFVDDVADLPSAPARLHPDDLPIRVAGPNPKRPGTKTHARFELFLKSRTVSDYIARATTGPAATTRKQALRDVDWAIARNQIVVCDDSEAPTQIAAE